MSLGEKVFWESLRLSWLLPNYTQNCLSRILDYVWLLFRSKLSIKALGLLDFQLRHWQSLLELLLRDWLFFDLVRGLRVSNNKWRKKSIFTLLKSLTLNDWFPEEGKKISNFIQPIFRNWNVKVSFLQIGVTETFFWLGISSLFYMKY